jgi:hypothetical protein
MIHMPHIKHLAALALASLLASAANGEPLIVDSFESGDMSATNEDGFSWGNNNRTSVVTADAAVYNNGPIENPIGNSQNWDPKDGEHSLRFRFSANEYMAEQRFDFGKHYSDVWIAYWLRVPINFTQGNLNSKFLALWPQNYDRAGTVTWQTRPNSAGGASLLYQDGGVTSGETGATSFISVPGDRGRWMHVVARVKAASGPDTRDGIIQFYRRWEDGTSYELLQEKTSADTWDDESAEQGISQGYILGWANDPYDVSTEWLLDQFSVHTSSPIADFLATISQGSPPSPPILKLAD